MKTFDKLDDVVAYIQRKHGFLRTTGVECYKLIRRNKDRIPFEHSISSKIEDISVYSNDTLVINQMMSGLQFRGNKSISLKSTMYLHDLALINVYDHIAEFFSWSSIDFAYLERDKFYGEITAKMLQEWILQEPGEIRAQWRCVNHKTEKLLEELGVGRSYSEPEIQPRLIHF